MVTIKTLCGSYTAGDIESGEHDVYNMVFRCRRLVLENQILLKKYKLKLPLQWQFGDEDDRLAQPHPLYFGSITTKWSVPEIVYNMTPEEEVTIYGSGLKET
ncbi:MAG: hypothetical protein GY729_07010 [Desulfobacteraceae bacterium]|nr:hypothetical protein [Desulfobacteraceae bacterium]